MHDLLSAEFNTLQAKYDRLKTENEALSVHLAIQIGDILTDGMPATLDNSERNALDFGINLAIAPLVPYLLDPQKTDIDTSLDTLAKVAELWRNNRQAGKSPIGLRAALIVLSEQIINLARSH